MTVADRLGLIVKHYDLSMSSLADRLNVGRATLYTYIKGASGRPPARFPVDLLPPLINAFPDLSLYWIVTGEGEMLSNSDQPAINALESAYTSMLGDVENSDYKKKYFDCKEKIFQMQDELLKSKQEIINSKQELINCMKTQIPSKNPEGVY